MPELRGNSCGPRRQRRTRYPACSVFTGTCTQCGIAWAGQRPRTYCGSDCLREAHAERLGYRNRPCKRCGLTLGTISLVTYCGPYHAAQQREQRRAHKAKRRAWRKAADHVETVRPEAVFERDGWTCGICSTSIDPTPRYPNPTSASLDHIVLTSHAT